MSTKLTNDLDHMVESLALDLYHAARRYSAHLERRLSGRLEDACGIKIAPAQLGFLAALVCGANTASDIARRLGVSRQAAQRQAAELVAAGYLTVAADPARRNRNLIGFTEDGAALMATCRQMLADLDAEVATDTAEVRRLIAVMDGVVRT